MFRLFRNYFITGVIVLLPLVATLYIMYFVFATMDRVVRPIIQLFFGREIYGLGVILSIVFILGAGIVGKNVIGRKLIGLGEWVMFRIPLARQVYTTFKQIIDALFTQSATSAFKEVVLIEYPRLGVYQLGFITNYAGGEIQSRTSEEVMSVFVPTTPNPTSGVLVYLPKKDIIFLNMSIEDGIKLILSAGVLVPQWKNTNDENDEANKVSIKAVVIPDNGE